MSEYSQLIGSFQRTGNFPFEAEYEFPSYDALHLWEIDPINHATLYPGLKKLVKSGNENLIEYWVIELDGDLVFVPYTSQSSGTGTSSPTTIERTNIEDTDYDAEELMLIITLQQGSYKWNEFIPLNKILNSVRDEMSAKISQDETVKDLSSKIEKLQGQVEALLATGGGAGGSITKIEIISFQFVSGKKTYVVDPNKLTEEEKLNGVDIPINWEYNINFSNNDKQILYLNDRELVPAEEYPLLGSDTSYTLRGVKSNTTVKLKGISKTYGLQAESDVLKITFGITVYSGATSGSTVSVDSVNATIITPQEDAYGNTYLDVSFPEQSSDDFRYLAIPETAFEDTEAGQLVLRDGNNFVIRGYNVQTKEIDGTEYYVFILDNIIHGSFTLKISK